MKHFNMNMKIFVQYVIGIIILTLGIAFTIQSKFGASPYDALLVGLFNTIGLSVGSWEVLVALVILICNAILQKTRPEIFGLLTAIITGIGIDVWLFLLGNYLIPVQWYFELICFLIGLILIGLGTTIYLRAKFAPMPVDLLMLVISDLTKLNLLWSRTIIYFVFLVLAFVFHGPIGLGTILTVLLGGTIINFFMMFFDKREMKMQIIRNTEIDKRFSDREV
ncbi:hypothetical protein MTP04_20760 [Lysinibacillus sp. PLM2]|nr:hypothetical protein MTP04_20760 [Lysinibacillus sp. PLM2]